MSALFYSSVPSILKNIVYQYVITKLTSKLPSSQYQIILSLLFPPLNRNFLNKVQLQDQSDSIWFQVRLSVRHLADSFDLQESRLAIYIAFALASLFVHMR